MRPLLHFQITPTIMIEYQINFGRKNGHIVTSQYLTGHVKMLTTEYKIKTTTTTTTTATTTAADLLI